MTEHLSDDALVALALEQLDPPEREQFSAHLAGCAACSAEYHALEDAVRHTLAAAPAIAPPAGFSGRVVAAMGLSPDAAASAPAPNRSRRSWTPWLAAAASLLVGVGIGVAVTLGLVGTGTPPAPAPAPSAAPAAPAASALVTRTGETVGTAGLTTVDGRRVLVVTVTKARPGMTYECVLVAPDGSRTSGGSWALDAAYGSSEASGTWVVPVAGGGVDRVELVAPNGNVWSAATF